MIIFIFFIRNPFYLLKQQKYGLSQYKEDNDYKTNDNEVGAYRRNGSIYLHVCVWEKRLAVASSAKATITRIA